MGRSGVIRSLAVVGLLLMGACGGGDDVEDASSPPATPPSTAAPEPPATTEAPATTAAPTTTSEASPEEVVVNVYWLRDTQIAVGGRMVEPPAVAAAALEELAAGPDPLEAELGMGTAIPPGTEVLGLTIDDGLATVDLSSEFEVTGMGTSGEIGLVSQVVFTLTQFPTVDAVTVTIEGEERDVILSHGLDATDLTRVEFLDAISPAIVMESPYPGQSVAAPLTVTGFSRTFEATVVWEVTLPPDEEVVAEGFTTAAQPDVDRFGPFEFTVELPPTASGPAVLRVFEESARDGSPVNVYEVPVVVDS